MGRRKKQSAVGKIITGLAVSIVVFLVVVGGITVARKGKSMVEGKATFVKSFITTLKNISNYIFRVHGVYHCTGNFAVVQRLDFKFDGTAYSKNILGVETIFHYKVNGDRIIAFHESGIKEIYEIRYGDIYLPLGIKCSKP